MKRCIRFCTQMLAKDLSTRQTQISTIMNYRLDGETNVSTKVASVDIVVTNKFNFESIPYLITWLLGLLSAVLISEYSNSRKNKQNEKEQMGVAVHKAVSFYTWAAKVAADPSLAGNSIWEKVFMENDTLLYLHKATITENGSSEMSEVVLGTIDLLIKIDKLDERFRENDLFSNFTKNLEGEIEKIAISLKNKTKGLMQK